MTGRVIKQKQKILADLEAAPESAEKSNKLGALRYELEKVRPFFSRHVLWPALD